MVWKISHTHYLCVAITTYYRGHWDVKQFDQGYITKMWNQISKIKSLDSIITFLISHFWFKGDVLPLKWNYFVGRIISYCSYVPHIAPITMLKKFFLSSWNSCSELKCQNLNILHVPWCFPLSNLIIHVVHLIMKMSLHKLWKYLLNVWFSILCIYNIICNNIKLSIVYRDIQLPFSLRI